MTVAPFFRPGVNGMDEPRIGSRSASGESRQSPTATVRLSVLGGFELQRGGDLIHVQPASQRLLAFLALHERAVLRVFVAGTLWLDTPDDQAAANLRSALWRLRRPKCRLVEATATHLRLDPLVVVDVREMTSLAGRLQQGRIACDDRRVAPEEFSGDLLPDWYDDWVHFEREQVRQVRLHALDTLCVRLTDARQYGLALKAGLAAVAAEPLRESAQRTLIRVHLAEGNRSEALRQYRAYCWLIKDELGLEPSRHMRELVAGLEPSDVVVTGRRDHVLA